MGGLRGECDGVAEGPVPDFAIAEWCAEVDDRLIHAAWWAVLDVDEHPYAQVGEVFFELDFDFLNVSHSTGSHVICSSVRIIGKRRRLHDAVFFLHRWNRVVFAAATRNR